jgi:hypothetical protein
LGCSFGLFRNWNIVLPIHLRFTFFNIILQTLIFNSSIYFGKILITPKIMQDRLAGRTCRCVKFVGSFLSPFWGPVLHVFLVIKFCRSVLQGNIQFYGSDVLKVHIYSGLSHLFVLQSRKFVLWIYQTVTCSSILIRLPSCESLLRIYSAEITTN